MSGAASRQVCNHCIRGCELGVGEAGFCGIWWHSGGAIERRAAFAIAERGIDPIEKKPVFHYRPGCRVYSVGGWGCSFHCAHCRNHSLACIRQPPIRAAEGLDIDWAAALRWAGCAGMAWTFAEPTVWHDVVAAQAERCAADGYFTVMLTHGGASQAVYRRLAAAGVGVWKVDIKGFSRQAYRRLTGIENWHKILDNAVALAEWGGHVELSYCPVPGLCDSDGEVRAFGRWVRGHLGPDVPVHLLAYFPAHRLSAVAFGQTSHLSRLRRILMQDVGLRYVYVPLSLTASETGTACPACQTRVIERPLGRQPVIKLTRESRCPECGLAIGVRLEGEDEIRDGRVASIH